MIESKKTRVLIVEDSAFMRKAIKNILEKDKTIEVVGMARDGEEGVVKARELRPDVVTMDINLPVMDGVTALQYIVNENICPVVMISSLTQEGALITFEALELGAFDYIPKPGGTISLNIREVEDMIIKKVKAAANIGTLSRIRNRAVFKNKREEMRKKSPFENTGNVRKAVVIGISTGGPGVLGDVLADIPDDLGAAMFIIQHMPGGFTKTFAERLNKNSPLTVKEVEAGDVVMNNHAYLGKGGYHLLLRQKNESEIQVRLSTTPDHLFIPSVDVMMESVLNVFGKNIVGVLMTGMGDDGARSMEKIKNAGGITIAESEETAVVFGMPKEAIDRGCVDIVAPNYLIANEIYKAVKRLK